MLCNGMDGFDTYAPNGGNLTKTAPLEGPS